MKKLEELLRKYQAYETAAEALMRGYREVPSALIKGDAAERKETRDELDACAEKLYGNWKMLMRMTVELMRLHYETPLYVSPQERKRRELGNELWRECRKLRDRLCS